MNYFKLFACCRIVDGAVYSLICDLQRNQSDLIPRDCSKILSLLNRRVSIPDLLSDYEHDDHNAIQSYINYAHENEYGFFCDQEEFDFFPELSMAFDSPYSITNVIIEHTKENIEKLANLFREVDLLGAFEISLIFYKELNENDFCRIFAQIPNSRLRSIEIISKWHSGINDELFMKINMFNNQVTCLSFFDANVNQTEFPHSDYSFNIIFVKDSINSFSHCGKVDSLYFSTSKSTFVEATNYNSCLNQKLSIDTNGNIKNCPAMPQSFGNIKDTSLEEALAHPNFKKYWNITKDHIEVCKDCEFRYICTDCRAYTERNHQNADGLDTSKPLKCGYNPYTGEWEEWSANPLKQKAIKFYAMQDMVKKSEV